jgi:hypothetical protein
MKRPAVRGITEHRRLTVAALVVLLAVVGVLVWRIADQGGGEGPRKVGGTAAEAINLVSGLQRALSGRDYQAVCDSLFTTQAREAAGGDNCPTVLAQAGAKVTAPSVIPQSVAVAGDQATVRVMASAAGQPPAADELHLVREGGRFRIASAGLVRGR